MEINNEKVFKYNKDDFNYITTHFFDKIDDGDEIEVSNDYFYYIGKDGQEKQCYKVKVACFEFFISSKVFRKMTESGFLTKI